MSDYRRAEPDLGLTEHGVVGDHRQVAHHHQVASTGDAVPLHPGNHRLGQVEDLEQSRQTSFQARSYLARVARCLLIEVVPGAERSSGPTEDHHPDRIVSGSGIEFGR
jgi:hypothetical protein